jgi:hypothetical protein
MEVKRMEKKLITVLQCLDRSKSGCQLGYVTLHTNIPEPLPLLEILEEDGLVQRCLGDGWSPAGHPMFEITTNGRQTLRKIELTSISIPTRILAKAYAEH